MKKLTCVLVCSAMAALLLGAMFTIVHNNNGKKNPDITVEQFVEMKTADETEKESDWYKELDDRIYVEVDTLPSLLNDYYTGNGEYIRAKSRRRDLSDILGWRDIDADEHMVCCYSDVNSWGMHKFRGCICKSDNGGKSWFRAGEYIFSTGAGFWAWFDSTLVRFSNSEVNGRLNVEALKAADMRISDSEFLPVTFNNKNNSSIDVYKAILGDRLPEDFSGGGYADDRLFPVLLSNSGKELLIGFQYFEGGYDNWSEQYEKKTKDGYMIQCYDYSHTDLPYCFIGKFNSDLEITTVVFEDEEILDELASYTLAQTEINENRMN